MNVRSAGLKISTNAVLWGVRDRNVGIEDSAEITPEPHWRQ